jgi:four helix bundle protein
MEKKPKINSFKDLKVWQKAMDISVEVYQLTAGFPTQEIYGLTNQIRRASNSVSLNIAEGHGRNSTKSYVNFLNIANGSLNELESGLMLSVRLNFLKDSDLLKINELIIEEQKMLAALITNLESKIINKPNSKQ